MALLRGQHRVEGGMAGSELGQLPGRPAASGSRPMVLGGGWGHKNRCGRGREGRVGRGRRAEAGSLGTGVDSRGMMDLGEHSRLVRNPVVPRPPKDVPGLSAEVGLRRGRPPVQADKAAVIRDTLSVVLAGARSHRAVAVGGLGYQTRDGRWVSHNASEAGERMTRQRRKPGDAVRRAAPRVATR